MEQNEIRFEDPVTESGITLVPVVRIVRFEAKGEKGISGVFRKEPAALIILEAGACKIFNEEWVEISMEDFKRAFPGMPKAFSDKVTFPQTDI